MVFESSKFYYIRFSVIFTDCVRELQCKTNNHFVFFTTFESRMTLWIGYNLRVVFLPLTGLDGGSAVICSLCCGGSLWAFSMFVCLFHVVVYDGSCLALWKSLWNGGSWLLIAAFVTVCLGLFALPLAAIDRLRYETNNQFVFLQLVHPGHLLYWIMNPKT